MADKPPKTMPLNNTEINRGVVLFNRARFFDAHEVLEDVWRSVPRDGPVGRHSRPSSRHLRLHVQGMVQLAVAFHHASTGNLVGARSVLKRALRNLDGADSSFPGLDLDRLRTDLAPWQQYLDDFNSAVHARENTRVDTRDDTRDDAPDGRRRTAPPLPKILPRTPDSKVRL